MGSLFPGSAHSKRRLRLLLRTDIHILRRLLAHFIDFCRKSDVKMGQEKHDENWNCLVSNGKHNVYCTELGWRSLNFLHNESNWKNNIGDRSWVDVDCCTWGGHSTKLRGRRENSWVYWVLRGVWMLHQLVLWCFSWQTFRVYRAVLSIWGRFSHIYYLPKLANWLYGNKRRITISCR